MPFVGFKHSQESKDKMSKANAGRKNPHGGLPWTKESREKLSATLKAKHIKLSPEAKARLLACNLGKKRKPETIAKIAASRKGTKMSVDSNVKKSIALKGHIVSPETRAKISAANKGRVITPEWREKLVESHKGKHLSCDAKIKLSVINSGENNAQWKGGISFEPYCPKFNREFKKRVRAFFEHRCVCCGKHENECRRKLSVHHIEYNKQACCDNRIAQFVTLCDMHHSKTNGDRDRWESMLHRIIDEIYDGKSYYTKEEWRNVNETSYE